MLQCRIWGRGIGNAGEWKVPTQWTKGKQTGKSVTASFSQVFPLSVAGKLHASN